MKKPITSWPASFRSRAATELSTPPDMARTTRAISIRVSREAKPSVLGLSYGRRAKKARGDGRGLGERLWRRYWFGLKFRPPPPAGAPPGATGMGPAPFSGMFVG